MAVRSKKKKSKKKLSSSSKNNSSKNKKKPVWKPPPGVPSRFPKGTSGNPNGRPRGIKNKFSIAELADAIKNVEKKKHKKFLVVWVEKAWGDPKAMDSIVQYMLPKLKSVEGVLGLFETTMDDELAKSIQDKLRERYK